MCRMVRDRPDQISDDRKGEVIFFGVNFEMFTARDPARAARMCRTVKKMVVGLWLISILILTLLIAHICTALEDPWVLLTGQPDTAQER